MLCDLLLRYDRRNWFAGWLAGCRDSVERVTPHAARWAARRPQAAKIKFLKPFQRPAPLLRPAHSTVSIVAILYFHIGKLKQ